MDSYSYESLAAWRIRPECYIGMNTTEFILNILDATLRRSVHQGGLYDFWICALETIHWGLFDWLWNHIFEDLGLKTLGCMGLPINDRDHIYWHTFHSQQSSISWNSVDFLAPPTPLLLPKRRKKNLVAKLSSHYCIHPTDCLKPINHIERMWSCLFSTLSLLFQMRLFFSKHSSF